MASNLFFTKLKRLDDLPGVDFVSVKRDTQTSNVLVESDFFGHVHVRADESVAEDVYHGRAKLVVVLHQVESPLYLILVGDKGLGHSEDLIRDGLGVHLVQGQEVGSRLETTPSQNLGSYVG